MNHLSQIFGKTLATSAGKPKQASDNSEDRPDPLLEAYAPTDGVEFSFSGRSNSFQPGKLVDLSSAGPGLPSLSRSYNSHSGGLLDITG